MPLGSRVLCQSGEEARTTTPTSEGLIDSYVRVRLSLVVLGAPAGLVLVLLEDA
jgi:hypothetical protein